MKIEDLTIPVQENIDFGPSHNGAGKDEESLKDEEKAILIK
jgi:hypothetical protein